MIYRLKAEARRLKQFVYLSRQKGHTLFSALLLQLPKAFTTKTYNKITRWINGSILTPLINSFRLKAFHKKHYQQLGDHFYMIVMPNTLHYLLPCLNLIPREVKLILIFNGTKSWERKHLAELYPHLSGVKLCTLPYSSVSHGDVLSLLLRSNEKNFGILDHDLYVFDSGIFKQLQFNQKQCMLAVYDNKSHKTGLAYPDTYFLFFNTTVLKDIMQRYKVDARIYRKAPSRIKTKLANIGLTEGVYLKDYHDYFDTLHVMLALAYSEGFEVGYLDVDEEVGVFHLGGTSMGTHVTKDLSHLYISMRFLEFVNDPVLFEKYARRYSKFKSSQEIHALLPRTPEGKRMLKILNEIMQKLETYK